MAIRYRRTDRKRHRDRGKARGRAAAVAFGLCIAAAAAGCGLTACGSAHRNPETEIGVRESSPEEAAPVPETEESGTQTESSETASEPETEEVILPARYDLREVIPGLSAPDQGTLSTCWAFAALKALETAMPETLRMELAADHMSLKNSFGLPVSKGGDYSIASSYLLAWQGPVPAAEDPYGDGETPEDAEPVCHVQETRIPGKKDHEAIKRAVFQSGGVQSSIYMPAEGGGEWERYYREDTCSYYYDGTREPDHDIVIVGWDDDWPAENFTKEPARDGAYLCMNTWGESFGDNGFFYVSYDDARIGINNVSYTGAESADNYGTLYQTDLCGWTGQLGYGSPEAWFANVYSAEKNGFLRAAGFYAVAPDTEYRIYTAKLSESDDAESAGFERRRLAAEGVLENAGFYTIRWTKPVWAREGERFAVIVQICSPGTAEPVAIEYRAGERTRNVDISDGEGYISFDGEQWQRAETAQNCNVCLKVYGD